ncbi:glutamine-hydrolyzing GMP synthase [candidate division WOR-3 bacterium RBG_13_43_14]|uniref:GMP synthase [glutamine-hydrolyzing] n=1 Tax=candidate division WOR-3 bacterium RBG_13_43_14 TaxID=1802590 RepID=A0A1F4U1T1_UNCW3|nr:MAG: glutamine-hydrolyzing GMP synthase [candidate division WOR-3 bacterium RBG_13_43_14]
MIAVIDFGSQYTQLIARRVRECKVYSEIYSCFIEADRLRGRQLEGIILSGGPGSVYQTRIARFRKFFELDVPVLGICYGMQLAAEIFGGKVKHGKKHEYGHAGLNTSRSLIFKGIDKSFNVWMSHGDRVIKVPVSSKIIASTASTSIAAFQFKRFYGLQFHPEVHHTRYGIKIIKNFLYQICQARPNWSMKKFVDQQIGSIRNQVGNKKVICALSGGVDSTVAAALTAKAIGNNLIGVFVDNGLLRYREREEVYRSLKSRINLRVIDARRRFLARLAGVIDPEKKRKIIGHEFIKIFEKEARRIQGANYLVQGTLYPDVIESGQGVGPSVVIKSHHNVGGLPKRMDLQIIEPLRSLFKDEVRKLGYVLNLPNRFVERKPFPGPGLAVRIIGAVNEKRIESLRSAERILQEEARQLNIYPRIWQIFAVLLPLRSVGVMGDKRTYDHVIALRAVESEDGMTADWVRLPKAFLSRLSNRITNEVKGINRVVFDITSKPPATIEWE